MNTKSDTIAALVSRIERAPNVSLLIDAYDAAVGGSDVSVNRHRGQWQISHAGFSGFCGDFWAVRARLAERAEEILERAAEATVETEQAPTPTPAPAMVAQPVQQAQACAAPRVAMQLRRTVTTHGIVAVDVASLGPCPEFPDHGRDEYRVTTDGKVIRTRYVLASGHERWSSPGARPFITPNRSTVTARRTIEAVAECLAAAPEPIAAMVPQPCQQQQANAALAPAPTPAVDRWVRVSSRIERPTLLEAVQASVSEFRSDPYTGRGKPVVRVDGASNVLIGWAENEEAAAACGRHWGYRFDVAVLVAGESGPLAYALLGTGGPGDEPEPAKHTVEVAAVANDFNSRMRGGTFYQFIFLPDGRGGFLPGVRADLAEGAVILSRAAYVDKHACYAKAWERSSMTKVRITLPVGTLRKSTRGWVKRLNAEGGWDEIELVGNMRRGDGWATIVSLDGAEIELT